MDKLASDFKNKIELIDKFLLILVILIPFSLAISIFAADLFSSISGIILIYIFLKKNISFFKLIKKEIILMIIFYSIILISLFLSKYLKVSFLPSFFYFRYFLVSLSIFYLLNKYDFISKIFFYSILFSILIVIFDGIFQYIFGFNSLGYKIANTNSVDDTAIHWITGFFDEEKKLGSYLVRFFPLVLSLIYLGNKKNYVHLDKLLFMLIGVIVFLTSERTALFLYLVILISYIIISKHKFLLLFSSILAFIILFSISPNLKNKIIDFTLRQVSSDYVVNEDVVRSADDAYNERKIRFYSTEHENLAYTSLVIFRQNFLFGAGVKSFYHECNRLKKLGKEDLSLNNNMRGNKLVCSTHPHSTYLQILSDIGIFGFIIILYFLYYISLTYFKILFKGNQIDNNLRSYYFINLGILVNLFPLIPSGNFFNNWICLTISCSFGIWLFLKNKIVMENKI